MRNCTLMMVCGIVLGEEKTTKVGMVCNELNIVNQSINQSMTRVGIELLGQLIIITYNNNHLFERALCRISTLEREESAQPDEILNLGTFPVTFVIIIITNWELCQVNCLTWKLGRLPTKPLAQELTNRETFQVNSGVSHGILPA